MRNCCFLFSDWESCGRFIFQETPNPSERMRSFDVTRRLPALASAPIDPLRRNLDGPINPEAVSLAHLAEVIRTNMKSREFTVTYQGRETPLNTVPHNTRFLNIWNHFPEMLAMKAATERVSERALVAQLPDILKNFCDELEMVDDFEPLEITASHLAEDLPEDNPGFEKGFIKPRHKDALKSVLQSIDDAFERELRKRLTEEQQAAISNELEFALKTETPFIREYMLSEGIILKKTVIDVARDYAAAVQKSLLATIVDPLTRQEFASTYLVRERSGFFSSESVQQAMKLMDSIIKH